ncbi:MAG: hypothetical protein M3Q69_15705 [Acidobacteriota bacterium]|nr:hypothetical protein [Acidobacteriota bacterium]
MAVAERKWRVAVWIAIVVWIVCAVRLMIADVWDETNGMLLFSSDAMTLGAKLQFVLTKSLGFWRPLPTVVVAIVLHVVRDFDVSWRILRAWNIAALVVATIFFLRALRTTRDGDGGEDGVDDGDATPLVFTIAVLYSGSAIIAAGWYANIFDSTALLLIAIVLDQLLRGRDLAAGLILGISFFCKETTALALPFLLVLFAARRITFRQALRTGVIASIFGAIYFALRAKIVPFGSEGDVHGFAMNQLAPTLINLADTFWRETLKASGPGVLGFLFFAVAILALRNVRIITASILFFLATSVIYWGMFSEYQNGVLIHHLNFAGRLYLVPAALMLFLLALERRTIAIAILLIPILFGGITTYRDHARFQRMYKRIYRTAAQSPVKPLRVHYPAKPLEDTVRGVKIGDDPAAPVVVEAASGRLVYK